MNLPVSESGLLVLAASLLALLVALFWRRHHSRRPETVPLVDWQARAEAAEHRAATAEAVVRKGLLPHLARFLRGKLLVGLLRQRSQLIEGHHVGTQRAEEFDQRLAAAHLRLQERLSTYESKIRTLENRPSSPGPGASPAPAEEPPSAKRRSPFNLRRPLTPTEPLQFREIVARRQANPPAQPGATPPSPSQSN